MEITTPVAKSAKPVCTKKIIDSFNSAIDVDKKYTLDELKKLLSESYKSSSKKEKSGQKREPSKYNIFVKNEILRLRTENPETNIKDLMVKAASNWKESKKTAEEAV